MLIAALGLLLFLNPSYFFNEKPQWGFFAMVYGFNQKHLTNLSFYTNIRCSVCQLKHAEIIIFSLSSMIKKVLFTASLMLFPLAASANCDLSVQHFQIMSQQSLNKIYLFSPLGLRKPKLVVSNKNVKTFYAEERNGTITIYPKSFNDAYCDKYFDGLTPAVSQVISHEYTHYLDEKLNLSKKIGEGTMSEKTAHLGESVYDKFIWHSGYADVSAKSNSKKYLTLANVIKASAL
jgi:hypothetical protein